MKSRVAAADTQCQPRDCIYRQRHRTDGVGAGKIDISTPDAHADQATACCVVRIVAERALLRHLNKRRNLLQIGKENT